MHAGWSIKRNGGELPQHEYLYGYQVIRESLRMYPTALSVTKETPKGGTEVDGYYVPGGTTISVCKQLVHCFYAITFSRNLFAGLSACHALYGQVL